MKYVTLVVEDASEPIQLGMPLAGGRVTAAGIGDYSLYCELMEAAKDLVLLIEDGVHPRHESLEVAAKIARDLITRLDDECDHFQSESRAQGDEIANLKAEIQRLRNTCARASACMDRWASGSAFDPDGLGGRIRDELLDAYRPGARKGFKELLALLNKERGQ